MVLWTHDAQIRDSCVPNTKLPKPSVIRQRRVTFVPAGTRRFNDPKPEALSSFEGAALSCTALGFALDDVSCLTPDLAMSLCEGFHIFGVKAGTRLPESELEA